MSTKPTVGWIGLGAMGAGMSASLVEQGFTVQAYDVWAPSLEAAAKQGAVPCSTPALAAKGASVLALMVVNAAQVEDVLFGTGKVAETLPDNAAILCFSTVPPSFLATVVPRLEALGRGIGICDSPVSGGSVRAAAGTLVIMTSGTPKTVATARPVLEALTRQPEGKLRVVGDICGTASDFKLINQVVCATQITLTGEAMAFGASLGLNPRMLYNALRTSSGDSFMLGNRVPLQLRPEPSAKSAMTIVAKDSGIIMDEARLYNLPLPLSAATEQLCTMSLAAGFHKLDDGRTSLLWEKFFGGRSIIETGTLAEEMETAKELAIQPGQAPEKILVVGLGSMGQPMALTLQRGGLRVVGWDVSQPAMDAFASAGGHVATDLPQEAKSADAVLFMTNTSTQIEAVLASISTVLPASAIVVVCSTIAPSAASRIQAQFGFEVVDAPVAGGPSKAATGQLTIMASGSEAGLQKAAPVLSVLSTSLHYIPGGLGSGSAVKLVNNLLAGVHICAAAEAFAFAKKKNMDLDVVFDVLSGGAAYSFVMVDRVPRMLEAKPVPHATIDTFVKDLSLILAEAKRTNTPLFLAAAAHQMFVQASSWGLGEEDDSSVVRLWEKSGVHVKPSVS